MRSATWSPRRPMAWTCCRRPSTWREPIGRWRACWAGSTSCATRSCPLHDRYDWILLDCSPSLGIITVNALTAAHEVLIPLQCETLSHRGVGQLMETIADVQRLTNPAAADRRGAADPVRRPDDPCQGGARRSRAAVRRAGVLADQPVDPVRRGARGRSQHPGDVGLLARCAGLPHPRRSNCSPSGELTPSPCGEVGVSSPFGSYSVGVLAWPPRVRRRWRLRRGLSSGLASVRATAGAFSSCFLSPCLCSPAL